jgi:acylphosphatase
LEAGERRLEAGGVTRNDRVMGHELREVWYSGHVQGVGFRYTVLDLARRSDVTGYVRNLPDGRVHVVVEGDVTELDRLLEALAQRMQGYIRDTLNDRRPATGKFRGFEIRP